MQVSAASFALPLCLKKRHPKQGLLLQSGSSNKKTNQVKSQQVIHSCAMYCEEGINAYYCKPLTLEGYLLLQIQVFFYSHFNIKSAAFCISSLFKIYLLHFIFIGIQSNYVDYYPSLWWWQFFLYFFFSFFILTRWLFLK